MPIYCCTKICLPEWMVQTAILALDMLNNIVDGYGDVSSEMAFTVSLEARRAKLEYSYNEVISQRAATTALAFTRWRKVSGAHPNSVGFVIKGTYPNAMLTQEASFDDEAAATFFHMLFYVTNSNVSFGFETSTTETQDVGTPNSGLSWFVTKERADSSDQRKWVDEETLAPMSFYLVSVLVNDYEQPRCGVYRALNCDEAVRLLLMDKYGFGVNKVLAMTSKNSGNAKTFDVLQCDDITNKAIDYSVLESRVKEAA